MATHNENMQQKFLSVEDFTEKTKPMKWIDLPQDAVFRIVNVEEVSCYDVGGGDRISRYAEMEDVSGNKLTVWLPSIVEKEVMKIDVGDLRRGVIFIRSLGPKVSKKTGYTYHSFKIVKT